MISSDIKEITLGEIGDVAIRVYGAYIQVPVNENVRVYTNRGVDTYGNGPTRAHKVDPQIGDEMLDGTRYAGISPNNGRPMYAMPGDAPETYTPNQAKNYTDELDAHGHRDWVVPSMRELNVLFNNCAQIGGFKVLSGFPAVLYLSSTTRDDINVWVQNFHDGVQTFIAIYNSTTLRPIRYGEKGIALSPG